MEKEKAVWGFQSYPFLLLGMSIEFLILFFGWSYAGKYHDSEEAFLIWLGAGSIFMIFFGSLWDNQKRKTLTVLGLFFASFFGFIAGIAYFDIEFFKTLLSGSYLDDMAAFFVFIFASNLLGLLIGFWIQHLVESARKKRENMKF